MTLKKCDVSSLSSKSLAPFKTTVDYSVSQQSIEGQNLSAKSGTNVHFQKDNRTIVCPVKRRCVINKIISSRSWLSRSELLYFYRSVVIQIRHDCEGRHSLTLPKNSSLTGGLIWAISHSPSSKHQVLNRLTMGPESIDVFYISIRIRFRIILTD